MRGKVAAALICGAAFVLSAPVSAETLSFKIANDSDYYISSFQTNEGDGWSNNWMGGDTLNPGQSMGMKFLKDGPCKIQVRVGWRLKDGGQDIGDPWNIDICKASIVHFDGDKVTYE